MDSPIFQPETIQVIKNNVLETDQNKKPDQYIGDYAVFELLGSGGFGSVYKVKKTTAGQSFLAMKEVSVLIFFFLFLSLYPFLFYTMTLQDKAVDY